MAEAIFRTPTSFCEHCRNTIEKAVGNLDGVTQVIADLSQHVVTVRFDSSSLDRETIRARIEGAGFPVTGVSMVE